MKPKPIYILSFTLLCIIVIFISYYFIIVYNVSDWLTRGQIGDTFGAPNAFLSSLAILGVIYSILQQNETIKNQRVEIEQSVKEFKESVHQFEQQQKIDALINLISIYEKRVEYYKSIKNSPLQVSANAKLTQYTVQLEDILSNI